MTLKQASDDFLRRWQRYGKGEIRDGMLGVGSHTCLIRVIAARRRR
jgi:hypothetical protein